MPKKLTSFVPLWCHFYFGQTTSASCLCFVSHFPLSCNKNRKENQQEKHKAVQRDEDGVVDLGVWE